MAEVVRIEGIVGNADDQALHQALHRLKHSPSASEIFWLADSGTGPPIDRRVLRTAAGILFIPCSLRAAPRRTKSAGAGVDSILAEMMELGRLGRGGQRQVRGVADRSPGVAHAAEVT